MMKDKEYIHDLLARYSRGEYSQEELDILLKFSSEEDGAAVIAAWMDTFLAEQQDLSESESARLDLLLERTDKKMLEAVPLSVVEGFIEEVLPTRSLFRRMLPYAAAVLLFLSVGIYFYTNRTIEPTSSKLTSIYGDDVAPGGNRATITLSDGTVVELNEQQEGVVADQTGLSYTDGKQVVETKNTVSYATLSTPRGGQYRLSLPDGTKVWLNAESSITYPTTFNDTIRSITFSGEGYFDVTHRSEQPFQINSNGQNLTVIGTEFNLNAYNDEDAVTTLVSGIVQVSDKNNEQKVKLHPGQQTINNGKNITLKEVETGDYTAWKNGMLVLKDADFTTVKKLLERWYDVSFVGTPASTAKVSAILSRQVNLSDVLQSMEDFNDITFKIEGRVIMVY